MLTRCSADRRSWQRQWDVSIFFPTSGKIVIYCISPWCAEFPPINLCLQNKLQSWAEYLTFIILPHCTNWLLMLAIIRPTGTVRWPKLDSGIPKMLASAALGPGQFCFCVCAEIISSVYMCFNYRSIFFLPLTSVLSRLLCLLQKNDHSYSYLYK